MEQAAGGHRRLKAGTGRRTLHSYANNWYGQKEKSNMAKKSRNQRQMTKAVGAEALSCQAGQSLGQQLGDPSHRETSS